MRASVAISALVHAAFVLWLLLAPGSKPFDPAHGDAILVELMPPDNPNAAERESPKPDLPKPPPKPESSKTAAEAQAPPKTAGTPEDAAETAARLAWILDAPMALPISLAAPPSELKSNLPADIVAAIKSHLGKCFAPPSDVPDTRDFRVLMRIALKRDGALAAEPELISAPASAEGPPLVAAAKRALRECQPYGFLPADKYTDWRILDLGFTRQGPVAASAYKASAAR
jgi:hypothetical protein